MTIRMTYLASLLALGAATLTLPACGPSGASVCEAECDCEGCSESDRNECFDKAEGDEREAEFRDCLDLYYDLLDCEDATGYCKGSDWETSCGREKDRYKDCVK